MKEKLKKLVITGSIGIVVLLVLVLSTIVVIPTGQTGIVTTFGKVENTTLDSGFHVKAPWQKVVVMDNRVQLATVDLLAFSKDTQEVSIKYALNFQISSKDAMTIYRTIGKNYYPVVISPAMSEAIKENTAKYTAEDLIQNRAQLAKDIETDLAKRLEEVNVILVNTSIEDIDFSDVYTDAVEAKQVAYQDKLRAEAEAETLLVKTNAQAEADMVKADAEAYVNEKINASLTDKILKKMYYEKWNGVLPQVMGSEGNILNMGLPN